MRIFKRIKNLIRPFLQEVWEKLTGHEVIEIVNLPGNIKAIHCKCGGMFHIKVRSIPVHSAKS